MEISLISKGSVKIKGKTASFVLNPQKSPDEFNGALYLSENPSSNPVYATGISIDSPGEYEIGGVKIKGSRVNGFLTFSLLIDGISLLIGTLEGLENSHGKLQEHDLVLAEVTKALDPAFMSVLATRGVLYFGKDVEEFKKSFVNEESQTMSKFSTTKEKLPQEMVTILLQ